jgi:hypothetical protein
MTDTVNPINAVDTEIETPVETEPAPPPAAEQITGGGIVLSLEAILYIAIVILAIVIRLPDLDVIPLSASEAHEALAVHRVLHPEAAGVMLTSDNPLMFAANMVVMAIGGSENVSARAATLVLGVIVVLSPILFRRWLGPAFALILSGLLALSPVLLVASRSMSGAVWSTAVAMGIVWSVGRFVETRRNSAAVIATCLIALLALAAEPAGILTLITMGAGLVFAVSTGDTPDREGPEVTFRATLWDTVRAWPWLSAVPIALFTLIAAGTVLLFYPPGLTTVGESLSTALRGVYTRPEGYPAALPLLISVLYEPLFWIFGLAGAFFVLNDDPNETSRARQFVGRALIGWLVVGVGLSLVYAGAQSAHALWLTVPLVGLSAFAIEKALAPVRDRFWQVPVWGPWLHGTAVVAILFIATINLVYVGRTILNVAPGIVPELQQQDSMKLVFVLLATVLMVITFFLVGSIWGSRAAWHGLGISLLLFFGMYSFNVGWQAAVTKVDDPREPWHINPVSRNLNLLLDTVRRASLRGTGVPDAIDIALNIPDDGPIPWLLRHYDRAYYVENLSSTINASIVIGPGTMEKPPLGAEYVGERYATYHDWDRSSLGLVDLIPWIYNRQTRSQPLPNGTVIVWVRGDVYGIDPAAKPIGR